MHPDEREFFKDCLYVWLLNQKYDIRLYIPFADLWAVFEWHSRKGVHHRRLYKWMCKWKDKSIFEDGVSIMTGHFVIENFKNHKNYEQLYLEILEEIERRNENDKDNETNA